MRQPLSRKFCIFLLIEGVAITAMAATSEMPIWQRVPRNLKKITEERAVIVSVKTRKLDRQFSVMTIDGGEFIHLPVNQAFQMAQNYKDLTKVSSHIVKVRTKPDLYIHCVVLHYQARMHLKMTVQSMPERHIRFRVVSGSFRGMTGDFAFNDYHEGTLLGFHGQYRYVVSRMPPFFVDFTFEAVLQHIAEQMRSFLEEHG